MIVVMSEERRGEVMCMEVVMSEERRGEMMCMEVVMSSEERRGDVYGSSYE